MWTRKGQSSSPYLVDNGVIFQIDQILYKCRATSKKVGGGGIRYTVRFAGKESFLFHEGDKWFVEAKEDNCFMILSQRQLEEIAASTTKDFNRFFFGDEADKPDRSALPTPIDQFAKNYLGLRVSFARLSPDGSICGVTAYADTEYKITELGITRTLALKRNQVILDESFIRSGNVQRLCAKRRFTLAHECAHQILFQLESEEVKAFVRVTQLREALNKVSGRIISLTTQIRQQEEFEKRYALELERLDIAKMRATGEVDVDPEGGTEDETVHD